MNQTESLYQTTLHDIFELASRQKSNRDCSTPEGLAATALAAVRVMRTVRDNQKDVEKRLITENEQLNKALALKLDGMPSGLSAGQSRQLEEKLRRLEVERETLTKDLDNWKEGCLRNGDCYKDTVRAQDNQRLDILKLKEQLAASEQSAIKMRAALVKLSTLGNGTELGNSVGNCIAIEALSDEAGKPTAVYDPVGLFAEINATRRQLLEMKAFIDIGNEREQTLRLELNNQRDRVEKLREALEFYADPSSWCESTISQMDKGEIDEPTPWGAKATYGPGKTAREALKGVPPASWIKSLVDDRNKKALSAASAQRYAEEKGNEAHEAQQKLQKLHRAMGFAGAWPVTDVLDNLAQAVRHLMTAHDCDCHCQGHEVNIPNATRGLQYAAAIKVALL